MPSISQPLPDVASPSYGGNGGSPFADAPEVINLGPIRSLEIQHGSSIDAIRLIYGDNGVGDHHGGNGGTKDVFQLDTDERVIRVEGRSGDEVVAVQFFTNKGKSSPVYGGGGGKPFTVTAPQDSYLRTISGRSGSRVDHLTFQFGAPFFIKSIDVDQQALQKANITTAPQEVYSQPLTNPTSTQVSASYKGSKTVKKKDIVTLEFAQNLGLEASFSGTAGIPNVASVTMGVKIQSNVGFDETTKSSDETDQKEEWDVTVLVPANRKVVATTSVTMQTMTVPFTYTVAWYEGDMSRIIKQMTFGGQYQGVGVTGIQHRFDESAN